MEGVIHILVLLNVHLIVLDENNCSFVRICATVIGCRKDCDDRGESLSSSPAMHLIALELNLMSANNREIVILFEEGLNRFQAKLHRTLALLVFREGNLHCLSVVNWI